MEYVGKSVSFSAAAWATHGCRAGWDGRIVAQKGEDAIVVIDKEWICNGSWQTGCTGDHSGIEGKCIAIPMGIAYSAIVDYDGAIDKTGYDAGSSDVFIIDEADEYGPEYDMPLHDDPTPTHAIKAITYRHLLRLLDENGIRSVKTENGSHLAILGWDDLKAIIHIKSVFGVDEYGRFGKIIHPSEMVIVTKEDLDQYVPDHILEIFYHELWYRGDMYIADEICRISEANSQPDMADELLVQYEMIQQIEKANRLMDEMEALLEKVRDLPVPGSLATRR